MTNHDHDAAPRPSDDLAPSDESFAWASSIRRGSFRYVALPVWLLEAGQTGALDFTMFGVLSSLWLQAKIDRDTGTVWASSASLASTWRGLKPKTAQEALLRLKTRGFIRELRLPSAGGAYPIVLDGYYRCHEGTWLRVDAAKTAAWDEPFTESAQADISPVGNPRTSPPQQQPSVAHKSERASEPIDAVPIVESAPYSDRTPNGCHDGGANGWVNGCHDGGANGYVNGCQSGGPLKTIDTDTDTRETIHLSPAFAGGMDEGLTPSGIRPEAIVDLYRRLLPSLPQTRTPLSAGIRKKVAAAIRRHPDLAWWEEYFCTVQQRPFLMGSNDRGWQATLTWLCLPRAEDGISEGRYRGGTRGDAMMNNAMQAALDMTSGGEWPLSLSSDSGEGL